MRIEIRNKRHEEGRLLPTFDLYLPDYREQVQLYSTTATILYHVLDEGAYEVRLTHDNMRNARLSMFRDKAWDPKDMEAVAYTLSFDDTGIVLFCRAKLNELFGEAPDFIRLVPAKEETPKSQLAYFREPSGDYLCVTTPASAGLWEGRTSAISGLVTSVCTSSISHTFLSTCARVDRSEVPDEWLEALEGGDEL